MKFCLIGCGGIAVSMHGPSYRKYMLAHPDFRLAACCDPIAQRAAQMREQFGFERFYTDHVEMLRSEKPDAVAVIVSEAASAQVGLDVITAGVPMLIEKPPGRFSTDTEALAAQAEARAVPCQVAFNRRYMPALRELKARIRGDVQLITYEMIRCDRRDRHFSDTAVHGIDAVRFLSDADYQTVRFSYTEFPAYGEGVCNVSMECELTNGAKAHLDICPVSGASLERASVHMKDHLLRGCLPVWGGWDSPGHIDDFRHGGDPEVVAFSDRDVYISNGFYAENEAFFNALTAGRRPQPAISSAINTMLVKECIDRRQKIFLRNEEMVR